PLALAVFITRPQAELKSAPNPNDTPSPARRLSGPKCGYTCVPRRRRVVDFRGSETWSRTCSTSLEGLIMNRIATCIAIAAGLAAAAPAMAQQGWYVGARIGRGNLNMSGTDLTGLNN